MDRFLVILPLLMMGVFSVISYNCEGINGQRIAYIQDIINQYNPLFLCLQETWLVDSNAAILDTISPQYKSYTVAGVDERSKILSGRVPGGVAVLIDTARVSNVKPIPLHSKRICALQCTNQGVDTIIASVYMPCDTQTSQISNEYIETINDLEYMIECYDNHEIILSGDWNTDFHRNNTQSKELTNFILRNELIIIDHNGNFTYQSRDLRSRSLIDHIFISGSDVYTKDIKPIEHIHSGCNLSTHIPLLCRMNVVCNVSNGNISSTKPKKNKSYAWHRVSESDVEHYQNSLNIILDQIELDDNCIRCVDVNCGNHDHIVAIANYCVSLVNACVSAGEITLPVCNSKKKMKPFWSDMIQPHKDCSLFWHSIWIDNGKPRDGLIAQIMRQTRARYHYVVRWAAANQNKLTRSKMAENVATNNMRDFWKECKRIENKTNKTHNIDIDGVSNDSEIAELFADKYRCIYNSQAVNDNDLLDIKTRITHRIQTEDSLDISCVDDQEVATAINMLNPNKSDGMQRLYSNHIILSSRALQVHMAKLFTSMLRHGYNPEYILEAVISSIPKNIRGDISSSENYRGIALASALGKILDIIIMKRYKQNLSSDDLQFAFKDKHSTVMCTAALKEIVSHYTTRGSNLYLCSLDATKAFDKVNFVKMFNLLLERQIPSIVLRLIFDLYTRQCVRTKWNNEYSSWFDVSNGVRQGGVLSPILFNVYMDELLRRLKANDIGCHIGNVYMGALCYADDIVLLCPTTKGLQAMLDICNEFAEEYGLAFNPNKTACLAFGKVPSTALGDKIKLNGETLSWTDSFKHLGNIISSDMREDLDVQYKRGNFYQSVNGLCAKFKGILFNCDIAARLFQTYCCSFYGSQTWNMSNTIVDSIYTSWNKAVRRIFNLPFDTHRYLLPYVSQSEPIRYQLIKRFKTFFAACVSSENVIVNLLALNSYFCNSTMASNRKISATLNPAVYSDSELSLGGTLVSLLKVREQQWLLPSFQQNEVIEMIENICSS